MAMHGAAQFRVDGQGVGVQFLLEDAERGSSGLHVGAQGSQHWVWELLGRSSRRVVHGGCWLVGWLECGGDQRGARVLYWMYWSIATVGDVLWSFEAERLVLECCYLWYRYLYQVHAICSYQYQYLVQCTSVFCLFDIVQARICTAQLYCTVLEYL